MLFLSCVVFLPIFKGVGWEESAVTLGEGGGGCLSGVFRQGVGEGRAGNHLLVGGRSGPPTSPRTALHWLYVLERPAGGAARLRR